MNFWSAVVRLLSIFAIMVAVGFSVWDKVFPYGEPIKDLRAFNGCYEFEGFPDFMRARPYRVITVDNGVIADRYGKAVSTIALGQREASYTPVTFLPGIHISVKPTVTVTPTNEELGTFLAGRAYVRRGRLQIAMTDEWDSVMQKTSCR